MNPCPSQLCRYTTSSHRTAPAYNQDEIVKSDSPGSTVRIEKLLNTNSAGDCDFTTHRTVVPLFTDVAGTVRVDCTVPEDGSVTFAVIPRFLTV